MKPCAPNRAHFQAVERYVPDEPTMEDKTMKYITCMGGVIRLTDKSWRQFLEHVANGGDIDPTKFGGRYLYQITADVTDWSAELAKDRLEYETAT